MHPDSFAGSKHYNFMQPQYGDIKSPPSAGGFKSPSTIGLLDNLDHRLTVDNFTEHMQARQAANDQTVDLTANLSSLLKNEPSRTRKFALGSTQNDIKRSADDGLKDPLNKDLAVNTVSDTALSSKSRQGTNQYLQSTLQHPSRRKSQQMLGAPQPSIICQGYSPGSDTGEETKRRTVAFSKNGELIKHLGPFALNNPSTRSGKVHTVMDQRKYSGPSMFAPKRGSITFLNQCLIIDSKENISQGELQRSLLEQKVLH